MHLFLPSYRPKIAEFSYPLCIWGPLLEVTPYKFRNRLFVKNYDCLTVKEFKQYNEPLWYNTGPTVLEC